MKNKNINLLAMLILILTFQSVSKSLFAQWTPIGPYGGGKINALAVSDSNIYAGTANGAFLSSNNGSSWTAFNTGLTNTDITSFGVSGSNVFAGNGYNPPDAYSYVYLSNNNSNWTLSNTGLPSYIINFTAFAVAGNKIYLGTSGEGIYISTNNGSSWTALNSGLFALQYAIVNALAVGISGTDTNIFVATDEGVYLSQNNGGWWYADSTGFTNLDVTALAINGSNIFAGTSGGGVFLSSVNGGNWTAVNTGLSALNALYINALTVEINATDTNIFAGTDAGMYLSTNNGSSWNVVNTGLPAYTIIYSLAAKDTNIFAGSGNGVYLSTNNGSSWTAIDKGIMSYGNVNALAVDINGTDTNIIAGTGGEDIFLSSNNGNSWSWVESGAGGNVDALAVTIDGIFAAPGPVFLSTDSGNSWSPDYSVINSQVYSLAASGSNIYAGTGSGIFTYDGGGNWSAVGQNGLTTNCNVLALAITGSNLFAGTNQYGVYRSTDGGSYFTAVNTGLNTFFSVNAFAFEINEMDTNIFAGTDDGVFLSSNNGDSWTAVNTGIYTLVSSLAISGSDIFAGTYGGGAYLSTNNGTSWTTFNTGLTNLYINALAVDGKNLIAGTNGGVFTTRIEQPTGINQIQGNGAEQITIYPNPSQGVFQLGIRNEKSGMKNTVEIYNVLGEKIYSQDIISLNNCSISLTSSPSGLYMYKVVLEDGSLVGQGKFVIEH